MVCDALLLSHRFDQKSQKHTDCRRLWRYIRKKGNKNSQRDSNNKHKYDTQLKIGRLMEQLISEKSEENMKNDEHSVWMT